MSDADPVLLDVTGGIARIRFNRPHVLNALDEHAILAFKRAADTVAGQPGVRVVVLSGAGRAFLAGGDVARFHAAGEDAPNVVASLIGPFHEAILTLSKLKAPVIASVQGAVAGGGLSVALAADLLIAADDAKFSMAYSRIATSPDGGGTWHLPRIVGLRKAMELALLSENIDAQEALRLGIANKVVPLDQLADVTDKIAGALAAGPTAAYGRIKALLRASSTNSLAEQLQAEKESFVASAGTRDFAEGAAAFVGKRAPRFEGH
ncbi:enoyl-CoA hydratase [Azorhizobium oxalatiphilum]|uniref:Enoyl-CoA hydratase n=1 Tax=Azorhizobium oxalatiphilum TaxID=980631 RepID=A0A917F285_9HYPH|nr:enoyl-CoA hydratase-related protein [Azorhizobium oxalatiphilum]GGF45720.1 enoyl-CoA hydratase [Azorhizobium oxalatiphilum]